MHRRVAIRRGQHPPPNPQLPLGTSTAEDTKSKASPGAEGSPDRRRKWQRPRHHYQMVVGPEINDGQSARACGMKLIRPGAGSIEPRDEVSNVRNIPG